MIDIHSSPDEDTKKVVRGIFACIKLPVNIFIGIMDFIPIKGAFFSWSADAWKFIAPRIAKKFQEEYGVSFDLTSGVSKRYAIGTEIFEFFTFGFFPSHLLETRRWYKHEGKAHIEAMREVFRRRPPRFLPN